MQLFSDIEDSNFITLDFPTLFEQNRSSTGAEGHSLIATGKLAAKVELDFLESSICVYSFFPGFLSFLLSIHPWPWIVNSFCHDMLKASEQGGVDFKFTYRRSVVPPQPARCKSKMPREKTELKDA